MVIFKRDVPIYHEGCKYLKIIDYEPIKVFVQLFNDLAKKDYEFTDIIVNIHDEKNHR